MFFSSSPDTTSLSMSKLLLLYSILDFFCSYLYGYTHFGWVHTFWMASGSLYLRSTVAINTTRSILIVRLRFTQMYDTRVFLEKKTTATVIRWTVAIYSTVATVRSQDLNSVL
jgi:hypothetical protein